MFSSNSSQWLQRRAAIRPAVSRRLRGLARRFSDDSRGSVAILFALCLLALCLFAGAGVDLGRWLHARQQTIAAMDAAVLAGGRVLQDATNTVADAKAAAAKYYAENTKNRVALLEDTISFDATDENTAFVARGNAYIKTTFLGFANISRLPLLNTTASEFSKAVIRAGGKENISIEISMMLDVTGSMRGSKITDLKKAATNLVNKTILDSANANPVRIAIIPFAEGVRLPSSANAAARGSPVSRINLGTSRRPDYYYSTDCVVERMGSERYTDAAPGTGTYVTTLYNEDGDCGLTSADELVPLTDNRTTLTNKISKLVLSGSTAGQIGTAWAWYTLSPNWNTLWPEANRAAAYGTVKKIAILMTDGEYNIQYNTNGISSNSGANGNSTTQARSLCTEMKKKGIMIYTVGFALDTTTAIQTMNHCATDPSMSYTPDTGSELEQAFTDIALKINRLYLTH